MSVTLMGQSLLMKLPAKVSKLTVFTRFHIPEKSLTPAPAATVVLTEFTTVDALVWVVADEEAGGGVGLYLYRIRYEARFDINHGQVNYEWVEMPYLLGYRNVFGNTA